MSAPRPNPSDELLRNPPDFSLVHGGPLFQIFIRTHLTNDALELARQRTIVIALLAWLPLFLLSALEGQLLGGDVAVPFLMDVEAHTRFLVAIPLMIGAELIVHRRMRLLVRQFLERDLVPEAALPRFDAAIQSAFRLRNSTLAELLLLAFVYGVGVFVIWRYFMAIDAPTWYATPAEDGFNLSLAGMWFVFFSLPLFQFLLLRWYFRLFIWARFLWQVSRIRLNLIPTHPDRTGGLGFLAGTVYAFIPLLMAHGALVAGNLANHIFYLDSKLLEFQGIVALMVAFLLIVVLGPLFVFTPQLAEVKRTGKREYGALAQRYVREFDHKWLRGGAPADEPLLGSADIQSLADLNNGYEVVRTMNISPVSKEAILRLAIAVVVPIIPLALTMMPLEELLKKLLAILL
ncbi:MAG: hypothetical protein AB1717_07710 [Pseudomonadota bacterium]